ncbi:MAG TPA: hypothetical protein VFO24_14150, partial [Usitatibacter sp.]|nr:hypothetical protein [Usitatibacter sp.]
MRIWIAGVTVAIAMAAPLTVAARDCDSRSLLTPCGHAFPAGVSFVDLLGPSAAVREGEGGDAALVPASQSAAAGTQPAVYTGAAAPLLSPAVDTPL